MGAGYILDVYEPWLGEGYSTYDATTLEFDFVAPTDVISFQYVFASDEYNEWVNSSFNDAFGFFLDGVNIAKIPGTDINVAMASGNIYDIVTGAPTPDPNLVSHVGTA